jgi:Ni/Co efflux regulator RcnB
VFSFGSFFGLYCLGIDNQGVPRHETHHPFRNCRLHAGCDVSAGPGSAAERAECTAVDLHQVDWKKPDRHVKKRVVVKKKVVVKRNHWRNGQQYSSWRRHQPVRDYRHYGLRRPGRGQEWIRVGNHYLLVSVVSGIIFGAIAAH